MICVPSSSVPGRSGRKVKHEPKPVTFTPWLAPCGIYTVAYELRANSVLLPVTYR
jgi:hypothetical protein